MIIVLHNHENDILATVCMKIKALSVVRPVDPPVDEAQTE